METLRDVNWNLLHFTVLPTIFAILNKKKVWVIGVCYKKLQFCLIWIAYPKKQAFITNKTLYRCTCFLSVYIGDLILGEFGNYDDLTDHEHYLDGLHFMAGQVILYLALWSFRLLVSFWLYLYPFWTPGLPQGVLSNRPCPSVRGRWSVRPSLIISETAHCFFLILDPGFTRWGPW